jgi:perosamine synthetase
MVENIRLPRVVDAMVLMIRWTTVPSTCYPLRAAAAVPYWTGATYRAAFRSILAPSRARAELRETMIHRLCVPATLLCGSGSLALEIVLAACGVAPAEEVIIPTFCCSAVVPPILNLGAIPVLADSGEELNLTAKDVAAVLTEKTRAVVVPHLFGNPADIEAITALTRPKKIAVIDDAAQALGATIDGAPAGSFGDAGILSFSAEKICTGIGGGVAVSRNASLFAGIDLPFASNASALKNFSSTVFRRRWRRWTFPFDSGKPDPDTPPLPYRREAMTEVAAAVALSLVRTLDDNITARRERVTAYNDLLRDVNRLKIIRHRLGSACLTQVIQVIPKNLDDDPAAKVLAALRSAGYEAQGSYVPIHLLPPYERWARHGLPHAETVWDNLVELPCEPDVKFDDVERIAAIVRDTLR